MVVACVLLVFCSFGLILVRFGQSAVGINKQESNTTVNSIGRSFFKVVGRRRRFPNFPEGFQHRPLKMEALVVFTIGFPDIYSQGWTPVFLCNMFWQTASLTHFGTQS